MIKGMALKGGNKFSLIFGIGLAIVAAVLIVVFLSNAKSEGGGSVSGPAAPVVVASVNIPLGTKIDASMVTVKDYPEGGVLTGAFNSPDAVIGQITTVRVVAGEQVIADKITSTGENLESFGDNPPIALVVTEGMRGTSIEVNEIVGAGGNIRPGDYVDVILSVKTKVDLGPNEQGYDQIAATVVQNLQVVAVAQAVSASGADAPEEQKDGDKLATSVTLMGTPSQAEVLALADTCRQNFGGRLAVAVRSFGDESRFAPRSEWPADGAPPSCAQIMGIQFLP
jgi:pilus assembly protein CpaB